MLFLRVEDDLYLLNNRFLDACSTIINFYLFLFLVQYKILHYLITFFFSIIRIKEILQWPRYVHVRKCIVGISGGRPLSSLPETALYVTG